MLVFREHWIVRFYTLKLDGMIGRARAMLPIREREGMCYGAFVQDGHHAEKGCSSEGNINMHVGYGDKRADNVFHGN